MISLAFAAASALVAPFQDDPLPGDRLAAAFADPPASVRLRMYWRVFGPAWTNDEIDFELAEMERAGIGGAYVYFLYPVALDDPAQGIKNLRFLSEEALATFSHAAHVALERGLRFSLSGGTGWPYGGPTVSAADSAQHLRVEFGTREGADKTVSLPALGSDERRLETSRNPASDSVGPVATFIVGPTGMEVKRAALGGEGRVLDPLRSDALARWLEANVAPLLAAAPGQVESIGCDSLEVYGANFTERLPDEFQRRRGYDLLPLLPRLFDARDPLVADLRFDYWRTIAELAESEFVQPLADWAHAHDVALELEPYGTPPLPLTAARSIDVPTGEHYEWKAFSPARFAAAGAHLAGRRTVGMEAWTWSGIPNRLADTLGDLKLLSDFHFLAGGNDLVGVDFPYSPRSAGAPGWLPYYGPCFNFTHPQWPFFRGLADYVARCQLLLQQGRPVADVALYLPVEDCFARGPIDQMLLDFELRDAFVTGRSTSEFGLSNALVHHSNLLHALLTHGFDFDGIDFWSLAASAHVPAASARVPAASAHVTDGRLVAGDGRYSVLVLHNVERIEAIALERIAAFCRAGGTLIATQRLPERAAGLAVRAAGAADPVPALVQELFGADALAASRMPALATSLGTTQEGLVIHPCGRGRALFAVDDGPALLRALAHLEPDMRVTPYAPEVSFVHRTLADREIYFLVNAGDHPVQLEAAFRYESGAAVVSLWQPLTGLVQRVPGRSGNTHGAAATAATIPRVAVDLELPAHGSLFVILDPLQREEGEKAATSNATIQEPAIKELASKAPVSRQALDVEWQVTFDGPDTPPARTTRTLSSWTEWEGARFFSGRATYTTTVEVPTAPAGTHWRLLLPEVRDVAEVRWNGERVALLFTPPFEADVTRFVKPGSNRLEITVANLPVNRFLALPDQDLGALRAVHGARFPAPEEKRLLRAPLPSGLIGVVELIRQ